MALVIKAVIPEGQFRKHTCKTKSVRYYQNQESVTCKQCTPMTFLLFYSEVSFLDFSKMGMASGYCNENMDEMYYGLKGHLLY